MQVGDDSHLLMGQQEKNGRGDICAIGAHFGSGLSKSNAGWWNPTSWNPLSRPAGDQSNDQAEMENL